MPEEQKRDLLAGYMIDLKLGAKAAEAAKVGGGAEFARKLAYNRDKTLLDEYLDQEAKKAVTPEAARKLYEETVKSVPAEQEVRARHILVENEDEAKKAAARVKGGEDFAKVAGELSKTRAPRPTAAISASSPRTAWSSPLRRPPSSSSPARSRSP